MDSGIYKIVNTVNGKFYIGSSTNLSRRKKDHLKKLSEKSHPNTHLQNAVNKYGIEKFIFQNNNKREAAQNESSNSYNISGVQ